MLKKSGLIRRMFFFILFLIGIILIVLLIRFNWDFNAVVGYIVSLLGTKQP